MSDAILPFTGERFTPECVREIAYEHWHRYAFASTFANGRRVLDAASGEGFGSALLARTAGSVLGVDIDITAIEHARARYGAAANLHFEQADVTVLDHLADASFDLIVSFETLEHVQAQERLLDGFARLLAPGGLLLLSTPDKRNYSDATGVANEHHVRELYREQFEALLAPRFAQRELYAQKLLFQSALWRVDGQGSGESHCTDDAGELRAGLVYPPMYYLAVCTNRAGCLPELPAISLYGDAAESVYADYFAVTREAMASRETIAELRAQIARLERGDPA